MDNSGHPEAIASSSATRRSQIFAVEPVVLDAGYNRVEGRSTDAGDVHFESAAPVASAITPVPGGVGPMTIAMLLKNTLAAAGKVREPGGRG